MNNSEIEIFKNKCREAGLKITPQRLAVYGALVSTKEHPTAEGIYRKVRADLDNISLDTVNRTLKTLTRIGVAFAVEGSGDFVRYDGGLAKHQHFRCVNCKRIIDFHCQEYDNIEITVDELSSCEITKTTVYAEGLCPDCIKVKNNNLRTLN